MGDILENSSDFSNFGRENASLRKSVTSATKPTFASVKHRHTGYNDLSYLFIDGALC